MNNKLQVTSDILNYEWSKNNIVNKYWWSKNQVNTKNYYGWSKVPALGVYTNYTWKKYSLANYENPLFATWAKEQINNTYYEWELYNFIPAGTTLYHWDYGEWDGNTGYKSKLGEYESTSVNAYPEGKAQSGNYLWKKYNVNTNKTWALQEISGSGQDAYYSPNNIQVACSASPFSIDSNTGAIVGYNTYTTNLGNYYALGFNRDYPYLHIQHIDAIYYTYGGQPSYHGGSYVITILYTEKLAPYIQTTYSKGSYIEDVQNSNMNAYPADGKQDNYWYSYQGQVYYWYNKSRSVLTDTKKLDSTGKTITSFNRNNYSDDGYNTNDDIYTVYKGIKEGAKVYYQKASYLSELKKDLYIIDKPILDPITGVFTIQGERTKVKDFSVITNKYLTDEPEGSQITNYYFGSDISYYTSGKGYRLLYYFLDTTTSNISGYGDFLGFREEDNNYYQELVNIDYLPDQFIENVTSTFEEYPIEGIKDNYWYSLQSTEIVYTADWTFPEIIHTDSEYTYTDGELLEINGYYYYFYRNSGYDYQEHFAGDFVENVNSLDANSFPDSGVLDNYFYTKLKTEQIKGTEIETVTSINGNEYPEEGILDGFWYSFKRSYYPILFLIDDSNLIGGVKFQQEIQANPDFSFGVASAAELVFTIRNENDIANNYNNQYFDYSVKQLGDDDFRQVGKFKIVSVKKKKKNAELIAYDKMIEFEKIADTWIGSIKYPITITDYANSLANFVGVPIILDNDLVNTDMQVNDNFEGTNITCRQILQYIAQVVCGYAFATPDSNIKIQSLKQTNKAINNTHYVALEIADNPINLIDKVQAKVTKDDIGIIVGTGSNCYIIENNPLLYTETDEEKRPYITNIYNAVKNIQYTPSEIDLINDQGINIGEYFTVNGVTTVCMKKEWDQSGVNISCDGNTDRNTSTDSVNASIQALRGKTNSLTRTVDETNSTLSDIEGDVSTLSQKVDGFKLSVTNGQNSSTIKLKAGETEISSQTITLSGKVSFTDLQANGSTIINGANIQTGTLGANQINFYGGYISDFNGNAGGMTTNGLGLHSYGYGGLVAASNSGAKISYPRSQGGDPCQVYVDGNTAELSAPQCLANGMGIVTNSDKKLKKDFDYDLSKYEAFYKDLKPVEYTFKDDPNEKRQTGFIAQEVLENLEDKGLKNNGLYSYAEARIEDGKEVRSARAYLNYNNFIPLNTMMIQKLLNRIDELELKIKQLEANKNGQSSFESSN